MHLEILRARFLVYVRELLRTGHIHGNERAHDFSRSVLIMTVCNASTSQAHVFCLYTFMTNGPVCFYPFQDSVVVTTEVFAQ